MRSSEENIQAIIDAINRGDDSIVDKAIKEQSKPGFFGEWLSLKTPLTPLEGDMLIKAALTVKDTNRAVKILRLLIDIGADPDHPGLQNNKSLRQALWFDIKSEADQKEVDNRDRESAWGLFKIFHTKTSQADMDKLRLLEGLFDPSRPEHERVLNAQNAETKIRTGAAQMRQIKERERQASDDFARRVTPFIDGAASLARTFVEAVEEVQQRNQDVRVHRDAQRESGASPNSRISTTENSSRHPTITPTSPVARKRQGGHYR